MTISCRITGQTFGHHPTSTAAIGKDGDPNAVLDARFRVRGVKGLRVVDASVFPKVSTLTTLLRAVWLTNCYRSLASFRLCLHS